MIDRDAVRSNAKYLHNVRPIDPEEICEYIEGTPHPAVVRQTLREEALDLRLVEREDGTFVPAPERTIAPGWAPERLPEPYAFALEDLLVERYGANWHRGETGDKLRETIRRLKERYYRQHPVEYNDDVALGYALYHLPDYYAVVGYVLDTLALGGLVETPIRVLDVGAGTGGPALGLYDYLGSDALVDYHAVEPGASADILERLLEETGRNFHPTIHRTTAEELDFEAAFGSARADGSEGDAVTPFDIVLFSNVLSELDAPADVVERYLDLVAVDGSLVAIEPADLNTSTSLREVERTVEARTGVGVYAPSLRLWPDETPSDRGWSFDVRQELDVPPFQRRLAEAGDRPGEFTNTTVQFSYSILRPDQTRRVDIRANPARHAKMADMERHVTQRVNLLAVKLSHNLAADDANPVFKIGDGSEAIGNFAVLTRESALNEALAHSGYGSVLSFENALVLWNDDQDAYNVVVDGETVVDRVA